MAKRGPKRQRQTGATIGGNRKVAATTSKASAPATSRDPVKSKSKAQSIGGSRKNANPIDRGARSNNARPVTTAAALAKNAKPIASAGAPRGTPRGSGE